MDALRLPSDIFRCLNKQEQAYRRLEGQLPHSNFCDLNVRMDLCFSQCCASGPVSVRLSLACCRVTLLNTDSVNSSAGTPGSAYPYVV